ncbi:hypothetical protein POMI540_1696 [Schizosaccharomyces pombe]|uniref:Uncharacterized protein C607.07c n=1 Tax=Schizosaccharomyces pombe (strain 972 / ATCC 24843) TaxID=284812 RepID=YK67_SCHPO|nr:uncharacterized protein SPAC607.07c [Schizosaccharomyces pombe]Q9US11.1 RecName: Full=Uncharacterized protein C607.07c [Schizosaccharomyces pombe 972h-]CAB63794.1 sequence orphan [Schizosaccharomyces pombe]|eukprot:NP_593596.1 uncharacterized protein SPAC607.07c [Schizosaccharomyces pombe]
MGTFGIVALSIICSIAFLFVAYGVLRLINSIRRRNMMTADVSSVKSSQTWNFLKNPFSNSAKFEALDADDMWDTRVEEAELNTIPSASPFIDHTSETVPFVNTEAPPPRLSSSFSRQSGENAETQSQVSASPFNDKNSPYVQE